MRFRPVGLPLFAIFLASSACSTDATSPSSPSAPARHRTNALVIGTDSSAMRVAFEADQFTAVAGTSYTVTIDPQVRNVLHFGDHTLVIPARSICVADAGYGFGTWDNECKTEKNDVTITALVRATDSGIPRIDFSPAMRFSPKQTVMLMLYVPNLTPDLPVGSILSCATQTTFVCVDEAVADPVLQTYRDYSASSVYRRIKHFSGYFVEW